MCKYLRNSAGQSNAALESPNERRLHQRLWSAILCTLAAKSLRSAGAWSRAFASRDGGIGAPENGVDIICSRPPRPAWRYPDRFAVEPVAPDGNHLGAAAWKSGF